LKFFLIVTAESIAMPSRLLIATILASSLSSISLAQEPTPGKQIEQSLDLGDGGSIEYLLYLPADYDASKPHPFMLFLHGRGESNGPLSMVKIWGPPRLVEKGRKLPYIIASPQCPKNPSRWSDDTQQANLVALIAHLEKTLSIDETRMYLTGLSMGGYGSWTLATAMPDKFAAVAPVCGKGDPTQAAKLKDTPVWAWHGTEDKAVPFKHSEEMVDAIRTAGGEKVRFTSLEGIGHNSWSAAYATPDLYAWFNKQVLEPTAK